MPPKSSAVKRSPQPPSSTSNAKPTIVPSPIIQSSNKPSSKPIQTRPPSAASRKTRTPKRTLLALVVNSFLLYVLSAHFFLCPAPSNSPHASTCSALSQITHYRQQAFSQLEPRIRPYVDQAQAHIEPYTAPLVPYYNAAHQRAAPHAIKARKAAEDTWTRKVKPAGQLAALTAIARSKPVLDQANKHWNTHAQPHVDAAKGHAGRLHRQHVDPILEFGRGRLSRAQDRLAPVRKRFDETYKKTAPHVHRLYHKRAKPAAVRAYTEGEKAWTKTVKPAIGVGAVATWKGIKTRVVPVVVRFWSVYVQPQVERIRDRVFEYKMGSKGRQAVRDAKTELNRAIRDESGGDVEDVEDFIKGLKKELDAEKKAEEKAAKARAAGKPVKTQPKTPEEIKEAILKKRKGLETLQDAYQREVKKLGEIQKETLVAKLTELRSSTPKDISHRFDSRADTLQRQGNVMIDKLEQYLKKLVKEESEDEEGKDDESRTQDALALIEKVASKIYDRADEAFDEVAEYGKFYEARELDAAAVAYDPLRQLGSVKEGELSMGWAWLEDVTVKDWSRFHADKNSNRKLLESFQALVTSSTRFNSLPNNPVPSLLSKVESSIEAVVNRLESRIDSVRNVGPRGARDSPIARVQAEVGIRASRAAASLAAATTKLPLPGILPREPEPVGVADRVLQAYREAGKSAGGWYDSLPSPGQAAHDGYRQAQRAVGVEPTPETAGEYVQSIYNQASRSAASVAGQASGAAANAYAGIPSGHDAYRQAQRAVGAEPTPEGVAEHAQSLYNQAARSIASAAAEASAAVNGVYEGIPSGHDAYRQAQRAVGVDPTPEGVYEHASSLYNQASKSAASVAAQASGAAANAYAGAPAGHDVYRQAQRAVGVEPTPEGVIEHAQSVYGQASKSAASLAGRASGAATDAYAGVPDGHQAYRQAQRAVGVEPTPEGVAEHAQSIYNQASKSAASIAGRASGAAADAYAGVPDGRQAYRQAQRAVGVEPSPEGVAEHAQSIFDHASKSVSSLAGQATRIGDHLDGAERARHDAARAAARAIGLQPSPEGPIEHIQSAYRQASSGADSAFAQATGGAAKVPSPHDIYRQAQRAAGIEPSPEGVAEHVRSGYAKATDAAGDFVSDWPAPTDVSNAARRVVGLDSEPNGVANRLQSALKQGSASASSALAGANQAREEAYKNAQKAFGIEPEPTGPVEHAQSAVRQAGRNAESIAAQVTAAAEKAYGDIPSAHEAYRAGQRAVGVEPTPEGVLDGVRSGYKHATDAAGSYLSDLPSVAKSTQGLGEKAEEAYGDAKESVEEAMKAAQEAVQRLRNEL